MDVPASGSGQVNTSKILAACNAAMGIAPKDAWAYRNLAWLQATCPDAKYRDGKKALENAKRAYELVGMKGSDFSALAAAYAENGDFPTACEWQVKAIEWLDANKYSTTKDKAEARSQMESYKAKNPYRDERKAK